LSHRLDAPWRSPGFLVTLTLISSVNSPAHPERRAQPGVEGPPSTPLRYARAERNHLRYARAERNEPDLPVLEPGTPVRRTIAAGQDDSYALRLEADQYVEIAVQQLGIDVSLRLYAPNGEKLVSANYANGIAGIETVFLVSGLAGVHRLEVHPVEKENTGEYEAKVTSLRSATEVDRKRYAAQRSFLSGELLRGQGKPDSLREAISSYSKSLSDWQAAQDPAGEANSLNGLGLVYTRLGDLKQAQQSFERALPLWQKAQDGTGNAKAQINIGYVYHVQGEAQKALDYYNQGLSTAEAAKNRSLQADVLSNIGGVYSRLGEKQKAIDFYNKSAAIRREQKQMTGLAQVLANLGAAYSSLAEHQQALDVYNEVSSLVAATGDRAVEAQALTNLATVYGKLADYDRALSNLERALEICRDIHNNVGEAHALNSLGILYGHAGRHREALDAHQRARSIGESLGDEKLQTMAIGNIGYAYFLLEQKEKAIDYYKQFLERVRKSGDRLGEVAALFYLGTAYDDLGDKDRALDLYRELVPLAETSGDGDRLTAALHRMARIARNRGDLSQARERIEAALQIAESARTKLVSYELRASYFGSVQKFYGFYVDVLMELHQRHPEQGLDALALVNNERARARVLLDLLTESRVDIREGVDSELLESERRLKQQLNQKAERQAQLFNNKRAEKQLQAIAKEIDVLTQQYQDIQSQIRRNSPRYAALTQPAPLGVSDIQALLDADTLLLEYGEGEERSYLWMVSQTGLSSYQLPGHRDLQVKVRRLGELLTARLRPRGTSKQDAPAAMDKAYWREAAALSQVLLGPVSSLLGHKRLLIVAGGALQYVPFSALPIPGAAAPSPLIADHEVLNLPSVSALAALRREISRPPPDRLLAVLADPVFEADDPRVKNGSNKAAKDRVNLVASKIDPTVRGFADSRGRIPRLLYTRREAENIRSLSPESTVALDFQATRAMLTGPELRKYRIIHIATHGLLDNEHPELSGILLSMVDERGARQNGFLGLHDVYNLKWGAELVVLSACQTGLGKQVRGEGLVGLTRGFMYAGTPRVMASLWKINDVATAELMSRFYEEMLVRQLSPSAALRRAQLAMWKSKRWQAPYYWAGFLIQGEWRDQRRAAAQKGG